jgi:hypothetical protein
MAFIINKHNPNAPPNDNLNMRVAKESPTQIGKSSN